MAFEPLLEEETSILASAVEACLALTLPDAGFDEALVALMRAFYSTTLSRKAIYERLRRVKPLPFEVRPSDLSRLEARRLVLVVTQAPPTVVPTPLGLYSLYVSRQPRERDRQLESLLSSLESEAERKLRLTLHTFVEAPLSDKEAGSVIFLLYNDSTAPARGRYPQTTELRRAIDRIVQAFVKSTSEAEATPNADGAPGRWYMGEANRKLRNSISIQRGLFYVKPTHVNTALDGLRKFAGRESHEVRQARFEAFERAFQRESSSLARNKVLFASRESKANVAKVLGL